MQTKICNQCGIEKDVSEFSKDNTRSKDGYNFKCKQCCSDNFKQKYRNDSNFRAKVKQWNDKNNGKWHRKNPEKHRQNTAQWTAENPAKVKEMHQKFRKNHPDKVKAWNKEVKRRRNEMIKQLPFTFTQEEWEECLKYFDYSCVYCGSKEKLQRDHFISAINYGPYTKENIVCACSVCNLRKGDKDFFKWYPKQEFYSKEKEIKILKYLGKE